MIKKHFAVVHELFFDDAFDVFVFNDAFDVFVFMVPSMSLSLFSIVPLEKHRRWADIGDALGTFSGELHGSFPLGAPLGIIHEFSRCAKWEKGVQMFKAHFCKVVGFAA